MGTRAANSEGVARGSSSETAGDGTLIGDLSPEMLARHALSSALTQGAWTTGNVQIDDWLRLNIQDEALLLRFGRIPIAERLEIADQLIKRSQSITNITSYLAGCINKSLRAFQSAGRAAPYAGGGSRDSVLALNPLSSPVRTGHPGSTAISAASTADPPSPSSASLRSCSLARNLTETPESAASKVSNVVRAGPSLHVESDAPKMSNWALEALKDSRNKGRFLSRVCRQLDTATCSELQQLTLEWMYNIAMAVAFGCRTGVDPNLAARHCLQSHADISSPGKVQNLREVPDKSAMPLVLLHLGSWNAMN